jgi:hypothetical protein
MISTMILTMILSLIDHDIIANPPAMSDSISHSFRFGVMKDFNVIIPSCTGELGQ